MSFSPSLSVVRLQELKLWQGSYENLIQKSKTIDQSKNHEHLDGISVLENSNASGYSSDGGRRNPKDWDKMKISPCKPFEQLLEEKLAEDTPMAGDSKPKKPFLRKGHGLARFRMGPMPPINNKIKDIRARRPVEGQKKAPTPIPRPKPSATSRKGILKNPIPVHHQHVDLSPLTMPDFVKPRGTWRNVFESVHIGKFPSAHEGVQHEDELQEDVENYEEFRLSLGSGESITARTVEGSKVVEGEVYVFPKSSSRHAVDGPNSDVVVEGERSEISKHSLENFNQQILEKINEYAQKYFQPGKMYLTNDIPQEIPDMSIQKFKQGAGELTLEEQKMERELHIFEELEKKVENSSFCSTNTSVTNLMASTPQKATQTDPRSGGCDKGGSLYSMNDNLPEHIECTNDRQDNIRLKLQEVAQKTDVLQQFLMKLRKMEDKCAQKDMVALQSDLTGKAETSASTNTSFSEDHTRWSTRSPSLTDDYTEIDTTCQSNDPRKRDACVNTSFDVSALDETVKKWEPCKECEELRSKFSDNKLKLSDIRNENSHLKIEFKELEKKYEQLKKDTKKRKENYEEKLERLQDELNQERKKLAKEKSYFESYVKESQNRATKKEREEITHLKQELADSKELLKLKDAKNGATQARLRTQIKQQEREISELKINVERLQRENAKLSVSQKSMRRPQEAKMLQEINKNLSKLTEETFKKQGNRSGTSDVEENDVVRERKKSVTYDAEVNKENEKSGKDVSNKEVRNAMASKDSFKMDSAALDLTSSDALAIEKRYEHVFGGFTSPRNSSVSTNLDKSERTLWDGSTEISYSNGNVKTISEDGQVIVIKYFNGDTKETDLREQLIRYHYASSDSWHIQYGDGTEVMEYKDGQKCTRYEGGKTEVSYPDGSIRIINGDGTEEHQFPDGRKTIKNLQGEQIILLPNGQREVHTMEYKRREYPDGTIRTLRKDGSVETVYANGRVRLKDAKGVLVMDTLHSP